MKITLTKISHNAALSQETNAFCAVIVIDGVPSLYVRNEGHGGCNSYDAISLKQTSEEYDAAYKQLSDYAASLPKIVSSIKEPDGSFFTYQPSVDTVVDELLNEHLQRKAFLRKLRTCILTFDAAKNAVFQIGKTYKKEMLPQMIAFCKQRNPSTQFLNQMDEDAAWQLWKQYVIKTA